MKSDYVCYKWKPYGGSQPVSLFRIHNDAGRLSEKYIPGKGWVVEDSVNDLFFKGELSSQNVVSEEQIVEIIKFLEGGL